MINLNIRLRNTLRHEESIRTATVEEKNGEDRSGNVNVLKICFIERKKSSLDNGENI